ncbi:moaA protein [Bifidobacterium longum]|uniref:moaA protein n=1 Tax=Bifidobacterium longum TaxID=216816 RepID=UPI003D08EF38
MAKRKHIGTVILTILVAALLAVGVSGWLFWQSVQRVIGEAQQAGEYAAEAQQSVGQGDFKQALEQMDSAGSHIVAARDETQGMPWQAAEYVPYYGSDVKAVRGMLGAAADAATNALPKIDSAAQGTLVDFNIEELLSGMNFSDGTLSIPKIASIKQDLSDAGAVLKRVKTSIYALPQPRTEQITEMVNQGKQVVDQIDETFDTLNTIVEKIPG